MNNGQKSLSINETFIIESENDGTMSACTGFFTNALVSCTGNTQILLGNNLIEANSAFSATTFYGDGSNLTGISTQDTFVTGGTYSDGTATFTNNTGGTFSVTGFSVGNIDVFVTGGTYSDGTTLFTNNTGGTFSVIGPSNYNAGIIDGGENWVDNGNGSINLPEIKVALFDNPDYIEPLKIYTIVSGTTGIGGIPPLANNDTNYIIVEYNNGLPRYNVLDNNGTVDNSDIVLYMIVYRANNFVHTLEFGNIGAGLPNKLTTRLIATDRFARESGCALGLSGLTGIVTLSSGAVWNGPNRQIVSAVNSQDDVFFKSFHSVGTWVYTTTGNTINNSFYDDGTNLISATAGKYLVNWYFRGQEVNDHLYELISFGEYDTIQLAEASPEPNLPELITSHAFLVGRIIVEVSATTGITQSAFTTVFQPSGAPVSHNDLAGIQGGIAGEYYHLDSNKYNNLALTNTNNNFSVGQRFNAGLTATTISATTYQNLPLDIRVTGGTYSNGTTTYRNNTGGTFTVTGLTTPFTGDIPTNTSQLINDGANGIDPFITLNDIPYQISKHPDLASFPLVGNDNFVYLAEDTGLFYLWNGLSGTYDQITNNAFPTGLERITEAGKTGWRLIGRNPANYGNIGEGAVDLSRSTSASSTRGAIGIDSFAVGNNVIASSTQSVAMGSDCQATSQYAFAHGRLNQATNNSAEAGGNNNIASGNSSVAKGQQNRARSHAEFSIGHFGTDYTPVNSGAPTNTTDRAFNIGNGLDALTRSDAFTIFKNGAIRIFRATLASITNAASGFLISNSSDNNRPYTHNGTDWKGLAYIDEIPTNTSDLVNDGDDGINPFIALREIKIIPGTTYTLLEEDKFKILQFTSNTDVVVTIPPGLGVRNRYEGKQLGDGQLIFGADIGVTLRVGASEVAKTAEKYSVFGLDVIGSEEYILYGKLELA